MNNTVTTHIDVFNGNEVQAVLIKRLKDLQCDRDNGYV